ncbi:MAG: hypothetical protein IT260_02310 [Saprospiraceae bacterium]|nr:hypothetical protein [Saprospiraceae bacterium]
MFTHKIQYFALLALLLSGLTIVGCKKDNTTEQETITTIVVHLTATDGSFNQEFEWNDLDGDGGEAPSIDEIVLPANKTFHAHVHFYDRSKLPGTDITEEVESENAEHLLVYTLAGANLTIVADDTDDNGKPFRLKTSWTTGAASTGTVKVVLRHEPDKNAANPDTTGEVDAEAEFVVKVE